MSRLLLNCDIGESFGNWTLGLDAEVMPFIDCANVACGFHAGDPSIMRQTVSLALKHGVQIGAHPAYQDLQGFGRRSMAYTPQEIQDLMHYQIGALEGICRAQGTRVSYVKPHGALYNDMMAKPAQLRAVMQAVAAYGDLPLMLLAKSDNSEAQAMGDEFGLTLWFEAFADRAYDPKGHLVSRQLPGAVHHDADTIVQQALTIFRGQALTASDGSALVLQANTLCVHGDNASSIAAVQRIREALKPA
ncbi:5-oxoprolinase subunit PxpA [Pseudomonas sp. PA-6-1D]|uniref:5-oxoprolinase subunit PxpA n=1 Tax=Pseudomonas TaxID=286 RepID=UPI001EF04520|nr:MULTISPECIES: 5-oxoprolinase subunit PxpA [unclassified Pseudomonas]MCF8975818.1 5-oxoprolinase subunit PxpA [Pseudomonas edaphica]MCF5142877.1 5-oxoprolinase subunit PxpA [Pseudomonas sp. PA-6-3C]MCF5150956.1 5-oxoprolinase subunit PxpA [Pseudomonas sp. PA-6-3F]MCF5159855.1 5-oxoprolinase subunit PxpA [Pseudomonas sp. PA-6-2E]MCF5176193.1 5-oxoprolinase subunit PxpA [Pseudomonas sp. PA-6-1D]